MPARISVLSIVAAMVIGGCAGTDAPLTLKQTIAMDGVNGRIDHMTFDPAGGRLVITALGNGTVEIIDVSSGKRAGTIGGLKEPQGALVLPESGLIAVTGGGDGTVRFFDGKSLRETGSIHLGSDADNIRYDPRERRIYVGYGSGAIAVLDAATLQKVADVKLPGHPESFQLEGKGDRIFVNVPSARQVAVIDRKKGQVTASWPVKEFGANFPMAIDEEGKRLFIACRLPAKLLVLDTDSGKIIDSADVVGDADDISYDARARRLYVSGGQGRIDVLEPNTEGRYQAVSQTKVPLGARTSLLVPELKTLYLAVPRVLIGQAQIRAYEAP